MPIRVLGVGNNVTTQTDHRSLILALTQPASSITHRGGLIAANLAAGPVNVSAMTLGIGNFRAVVPNTVGSGYFLVQHEGQTNLNFDPGEAAVTRTDRVIVRVYNDPQDGSGQEIAAVEYLKGQSSGSASALPSNSLLLWEFPVPAGASSGSGGINFTSIAVDKRVWTTASGGIMPVDNTTQMEAILNPYEGMAVYHKVFDGIFIYDGSNFKCRSQLAVSSYSTLSTIPNPFKGLTVYVRDTEIPYSYNGSSWVVGTLRVKAASLTALQALPGIVNGTMGTTTDTGYEYRYNGSSWIRQPIIRTGESTATSGSFVTVNYGVTLPAAPVVTADVKSGSASHIGPKIMITNVTTTSFQVRVDVDSGTAGLNIPIMWTAIV